MLGVEALLPQKFLELLHVLFGLTLHALDSCIKVFGAEPSRVEHAFK